MILFVNFVQNRQFHTYVNSLSFYNQQACSQLQLAVDPYKCDNAKLVQECNKVHLELIELKETHQKQINDYKKKIRKLESELSDLQLSFSKNLQRIKQLETESANKSKKILELQGKCCKPIVNNVNLGKYIFEIFNVSGRIIYHNFFSFHHQQPKNELVIL